MRQQIFRNMRMSILQYLVIKCLFSKFKKSNSVTEKKNWGVFITNHCHFPRDSIGILSLIHYNLKVVNIKN